MSISIKKYVDITSGVGAGAVVRQRDLITRIFTSNPRVPADGLVEVGSASEALEYFGTGSEEDSRASLYFGFVSKLIVASKKLQFARFASIAAPPRIYGSRFLSTLAALKLITAGTLTITAGDTTEVLTGIDLSVATSLAEVATILETAIRTSVGDQFPAATVTFDPVRNTFDFSGSVATSAPVSVTLTGGSSDIGAAIGWGPLATFSPGVLAQSAVEAVQESADQSNNFGSFLFTSALTDAEVVEVAEWNATRNVEFIYLVRATDVNVSSLGAALLTVAGTAITYAPDATEWDEMVPGIVMAATDYSKRNSVQNFMFQQFSGLTPKVRDTTFSNTLDNLRVNYYGNTQTAGQQINFYQRGVMGGSASAPVDINVYANELWLKDAAAANVLSLLLSMARVPANIDGQGQIIAILQDAIDRALFNGVISVGKRLTTLQRLYITEMTGDELAWHQIQNIGYWLTCTMDRVQTVDGRTEFKATYILVYSKDDAVRKVEGTHVLI